MDNYCNYHNAEWCNRFDGLINAYYKTKIDGNTLYIIHQATKRTPIYKNILGSIYRKTDSFNEEELSVCALIMCKLKESTLIDVLKSYGFEIEEE